MAPSPSGPFVAAFEHGVLSRQWTFFIRSCSSSLSPSYLTKRKALCSKMLMVFKPVSCPGVFTRAYLCTALPRWAAAKPGIAHPHVPRPPWPCPNPRRPHATCAHLTPLGVGRPSASPGLPPPLPGSRLAPTSGRMGPAPLRLSAPSSPRGRDLVVFASPELFCSGLKLPGTGNNNPGRRWQQAA